MPQGLQIWNADGSLQIGIPTRLTRFLGTFLIDAALTSGSIYHAGFATGRPFAVPLDWNGNQPDSIPQLYPEADRIDWQYLYVSGARASVLVHIGVF